MEVEPTTIAFTDRFCIDIFFSFTLYPACSRVGRGGLVLRQSVPHVLSKSRGIRCSVAVLYAALCLDTRMKKWNYKVFHFLQWESNLQPIRLQSNPFAPAPGLAS